MLSVARLVVVCKHYIFQYVERCLTVSKPHLARLDHSISSSSEATLRTLQQSELKMGVLCSTEVANGAQLMHSDQIMTDADPREDAVDNLIVAREILPPGSGLTLNRRTVVQSEPRPGTTR